MALATLAETVASATGPAMALAATAPEASAMWLGSAISLSEGNVCLPDGAEIGPGGAVVRPAGLAVAPGATSGLPSGATEGLRDAPVWHGGRTGDLGNTTFVTGGSAVSCACTRPWSTHGRASSFRGAPAALAAPAALSTSVPFVARRELKQTSQAPSWFTFIAVALGGDCSVAAPARSTLAPRWRWE